MVQGFVQGGLLRLGGMQGLTRRRLPELLGAARDGVALGRLPGALAATPLPHQPGIATPSQSRLRFAAFDATAANRKELRDLMREWSAQAAKLSKQHRA